MSRPRDDHGRFVLRGAAGTVLLQAASIGLSFGTTVALARVLGADGFGAYSYGLTWSLLLLGPATLGLGPILTREIAAGVETKRWGRVRAALTWTIGVALIASTTVALLGLAAVGALEPWIAPANVAPLLVVMPITGAAAGLLVARQALIGLKRVIWAQIAESVVRPALLLLMLGVPVGLDLAVAPATATGMYGLASVASLLVMVSLLYRSLPAEIRAAVPEPDAKAWIRSALPLLLTGLARDLNSEASVLVLGSMLSPQDVGLFRAAQRLASLPTYVLTALNLSFNPVAASLCATGELGRLETLAIRGARGAVVVSLPLLLGFVFGGGWLLGWFGPEFVDARPALLVMTAGHLFNVACGSVGVILLMSGHEDDTARVLVFSSVITIAANVVLIQAFGLIGAAAATSIGLVTWNVLLLWFTWKRLGIVPAAFSWRRLRW